MAKHAQIHANMMPGSRPIVLPGLSFRSKERAMRSTIPIATTLLMLGAANAAHAASSDWFEMEGASIRLVTAGRPDAEGRLRGMLDIKLKPGWKTYWRDPGDSGVPPTIDVSANPNITSAAFDFPAPQRHDDGGFLWAGYDYPIGLPVTFTLKDAAGPATIDADTMIDTYREVRFGEQVPAQAQTGSQLVGWTVEHDASRIVYLLPGHGASTMAHPQFRRLLANACAWVATVRR